LTETFFSCTDGKQQELHHK